MNNLLLISALNLAPPSLKLNVANIESEHLFNLVTKKTEKITVENITQLKSRDITSFEDVLMAYYEDICIFKLTEAINKTLIKRNCDATFINTGTDISSMITKHNFIKNISATFSALITEDRITISNKNLIIKKIKQYFTTKLPNSLFKDIIMQYLRNLFESCSLYEEIYLSNQQLKNSEIQLDHWIIEQDKRYSTNKKFDYGCLVLEDELGYFSRTLRGLAYFIQQRVNENRDLTYELLKKTAGIMGAAPDTNISYCFAAGKSNSENLYEVLKTGFIVNKFVNCKSNNILNQEDLEDFLSYICSTKLQLCCIDNKSHIYIVFDKTIDLFKLSTKIPEIQDQLKLKFKYTLLANNHENIVQKPLLIKVNSIVKQKDEYCNKLLQEYIEQTADIEAGFNFVLKTVILCCELQRLHIFNDTNGRLTFFIMLTVLLYERGLAVKKMLDNPWLMCDSMSPETIATEIIQLCIVTTAKFSSPLYWRVGIDQEEDLRISCAINDKTNIKKILTNYPELKEKQLIRNHTFYGLMLRYAYPGTDEFLAQEIGISEAQQATYDYNQQLEYYYKLVNL